MRAADEQAGDSSLTKADNVSRCVARDTTQLPASTTLVSLIRVIPVLAALLDLLGPPQGRRVVDLVCGRGRVAREVAKLGATVIGVDLFAALLDKAEPRRR
jgi:2-polyprenyl-3-methyl-5-hydroxy-6-metoxy-1,4-benzoquinol methylase